MANSPFDEPTQNTAEAQPVPRELPRLRIHHLLTITAVTAVLLTIVRLVLPVDQIAREQRAAVGLQLGVLLIYCIGITCTGFALHWWWKGLPAFRQPGQWLLLVFPATAVGLVMMYVLTLVMLPRPNSVLGARYLFLIPTILSLAVPILFYGYGAWRIADTVSWRVFFGLTVAGSLFQLLLIVDSSLLQTGLTASLFRSASASGWILAYTFLPAALTFVSLSSAMVMDARKRRRHWSHWAGAGLVASGRLFNLSTAIWVFMAPQLVLP
jgi:hypothetical protein